MSRRQRRAEERVLTRKLRHQGWRCLPTIHQASYGPQLPGLVFGGGVEYRHGCPLGAVPELNKAGLSLGVVTGPSPTDVHRPGPRVEASPEVFEHAARVHARRCPSVGHIQSACPCGPVLAIVCRTCREPVYLAVTPGDWCEHAEEVPSPGPHWWGAREAGDNDGDGAE
jgi:hypothetical protein